MFFNTTQGTPFYTPDLDRPAYREEWFRSHGGRLTWQASPEEQGERLCRLPVNCIIRGRGEFDSPEAYTVDWITSGRMRAVSGHLELRR